MPVYGAQRIVEGVVETLIGGILVFIGILGKKMLKELRQRVLDAFLGGLRHWDGVHSSPRGIATGVDALGAGAT